MNRGESYLAKIPDTAERYFGAVSVGSKIILVGGLGDSISDKIRVIDFNGVENYEEAKNKKWKEVGRLKNAISLATIQVVNNKLWIEGYKHSETTKQPIQVCNMNSWTCKEIDNLITSSYKRGLGLPISYQ